MAVIGQVQLSTPSNVQRRLSVARRSVSCHLDITKRSRGDSFERFFVVVVKHRHRSPDGQVAGLPGRYELNALQSLLGGT
jgi:hypothetical protein